MSDAEDTEKEAEPAVELGEGPEVDGAPISRIAARFQWGRERSAIVAREGETEIRTDAGSQALKDILAEVDETYFSTRQDFVTAVRDVIGQDPVATED